MTNTVMVTLAMAQMRGADDERMIPQDSLMYPSEGAHTFLPPEPMLLGRQR